LKLWQNFPERQAPRLVDAAAQGRVQHELHAARFVEEALENEGLGRRHDAERPLALGEIGRDLLGGGTRERVVLLEPCDRRIELVGLARLIGPGKPGIGGGAQPRHRRAHLVAARRRLAQPERHRRRLPLGVGDAHHAVADLQDAPGGVAELEDVSWQRFDREVLVQGADERALGFEPYAVIEHFGDRAARHDRDHARAAPLAKLPVHGVVVHERRALAALGGIAVREHGDDLVELGLFQAAVRVGAAEKLEQRLLVPFLCGRFGCDLLREHVERLVGDEHAIELAVLHRAHHRRAFDQVVAREREHAALGQAAHGVA